MLRNIAKYMNDRIAHIFNVAASTYDTIEPRVFQNFAQILINYADLSEHHQVLDVATGRGAVLFQAAKQLPNGHIVGIDVANEMIRLARHELNACELRNATLLQMDVNHLAFPDESFDRVLCGFGLKFFPDLTRGCEQMWRVIKPNGRLVVSVMGRGDPAWKEVRAVKETMKQRFGYSSPITTKGIDIPLALQHAGFELVKVRLETKHFFFDSAERWWQWEQSTYRRGFTQGLTAKQLATYKVAMIKQVERLLVDQRIPKSWEVQIYCATKLDRVD